MLRAWQNNKITTLDLYSTALQLRAVDDKKLLDWDNNEECSVTMEIIAYLDCLDMDFITQEDVEPAIEFLETRINNFDEGLKKWQQYTSSIDYEERVRRLNGVYPYIYDERYPKAVSG